MGIWYKQREFCPFPPGGHSFHVFVGSYSSSVASLPSFQEVVGEELLAEIDVGHDHAAAAVPSEAEGVHGISFRVLGLEQVEVDLPPS